MVMAEERRMASFVQERLSGRVPANATAAGLVVFAVVVIAFWFWWPAGILLGLLVGCVIVLHLGRTMQAAALAEPAVGLQALTGEDDIGHEFGLLRARLGDDLPAFGLAATLVTQAQWASVAALQRELRITTAYAQHLMGLLEREGFVGPSRGTRPRVVRVARDRSADLERLLHV